ncbi:rho guanine nucleotide exchange factor 10-like isoform X1 [Sinocyclocheilus rhinocerous]|uniref:rho guanine nucleotide exchange factor 10-like isoform X1 n=1 Tax=Sinocyclocheilus rhinocerous TaxID=307959 RepID=UPI0007BA9634|nr:PREDICTED: rho guanine nucleotide exchange factor 10-like isoform X1 [Sinocyclocheilus rhinocerous]XP_016384564.1 PREDICTED: rho guanine nucleotide exchange factor 10-like isoform X1 [Sinocyclocheilus rhinocerous]
MDMEDFPPPPPDLLDDEDEGEEFEFDDSGDEAPEADRPPPEPEGILMHPPCSLTAGDAPVNGTSPNPENLLTAEADLPPPPQDCPTNNSSLAHAPFPQCDLPPPPIELCQNAAERQARDPPPPSEGAIGAAVDSEQDVNRGAGVVTTSASNSKLKVSPYSVIDIAPLQQHLLSEQSGPPYSPPAIESERDIQDVPSSPGLLSGYSVPVPCGYATPSNVPVIPPTYTTPVIIRHFSMDEDVTVVGAGNTPVDSVFSEECPVIREEDALTKWVSDPANTAWMESPDEVIYDDVPRENSGSTTDPDEMIYDDVEFGEEGGSSSLDNGWSSSEFESYEEASDTENGHGENGLPDAFVRGRAPSKKTHLSEDLARLKEHYERKMRDLMANTVGTVELQQLKHKHEQKMQRLVKAAKDGTKDGLQKTKAAVRKGRSFIRTRSLCHEKKPSCFDEESDLFIEVECFNVDPVLGPAPDGLSQHQVMRRCILEMILESEKNYLEALKRILEQYEKPLAEIEPRLLSDRKRKVMFYRIREILQCHALFQMALASRVSDWDELEMIGDVFVASFSKSMVLDAYSEYVNNFSLAMGVVRKACAAKPCFLDFLKHRQETSKDRLTLYGLMMKPIQRFPQFILLLQDMLKNTPVGHPDRLPLQMALTELETLAEKLNERKREADQRCEIRHIAKAMNEHYLNKLLSSGSRYLIRSDDVVETVYNDRGEIIKTKERRVFLLNDVLMCATPNWRPSQDGVNVGAGGEGVPSGQRFLLKWSVPLSLVEVVEFGSSEEMGDSRFPPSHSGDKFVINAKPSKFYMGPGQLYQDLQNLIHDLGLVNQISTMISSLKGNYQNVNGIVAQDWVSGLQRLILKKEEEIRAADRCRIQLQLPGKQDKYGRPTFFTAVFNTFSPSIKQAWISNMQMAKLALQEDNIQGWFCAEDDGNQMRKQNHPLLLKQMAVVMSKLQEFKVECAVHNPEPHVNTDSTADLPVMGHGCVWVASCTNHMGQVSIVALQNSNPKVTECFNVESRILCMTYVPLDEPLENGEMKPEDRKASGTPTVCLGMEEGSISVYKSSQRSKKVRLQHFFSPDKSSVTCLVYKSGCLYAGLVSGSLVVYSRADDGSWVESGARVLKLGVLPVKALLVVGEHVWASSGGQIFIISTQTHTVERQFEAHQEEGMVVSHMVVAGVGIWISFSTGSTLRLFHTETLDHLQDINIATAVNNLLPGQQRVSVSSLLVCHGLLLVGTNLGVTVALSVPRLQGIPKVTGRGMVSFHAHHGPVKFLTMATAVCNVSQATMATLTSNTPSQCQPGAPEVEGTQLDESCSGVGCSSTSSPSHAPVLQDSLSSSCGSLALSQGSLEHGSEDGAIYDLLNEPAHFQKAKQTEKVNVSSLLVVSGGLGHRRINRKTKQSKHEEMVSTIMVWQIPLPIL